MICLAFQSCLLIVSIKTDAILLANVLYCRLLLGLRLGLVLASLSILDIAEELAVHALWEPEWNIPSLLDAIAVVLVASVVSGGVRALCHFPKGRPNRRRQRLN